jgi:hypothetical protein
MAVLLGDADEVAAGVVEMASRPVCVPSETAAGFAGGSVAGLLAGLVAGLAAHGVWPVTTTASRSGLGSDLGLANPGGTAAIDGANILMDDGQAGPARRSRRQVPRAAAWHGWHHRSTS